MNDDQPILVSIDGILVDAKEIPGLRHEWNERGTVTVTDLETGETFDLTADNRGVVATVDTAPSEPPRYTPTTTDKGTSAQD